QLRNSVPRESRSVDTSQRKSRPATQAAFSSRENSSNGGKSVKTRWRNLMSRKSRVSSEFWEINSSVFRHLRKRLTAREKVRNRAKPAPNTPNWLLLRNLGGSRGAAAPPRRGAGR